jgi:hypothetical protein
MLKLYTSYILYITAIIIIFEQLYRLTKTTIKYQKSYDYGKILNKLCNNEYFEYETSRFNVLLNTNNDDFTNKNNYMTLILIISIIFTIVISFNLSYLIYNIFGKIDSSVSYSLFSKLYIFLIILICSLTMLYPIIMMTFYLIKKENITPFNDKGELKNLKPLLLITLILVLLKIKYSELPKFENEINSNKYTEIVIFIFYTVIYLFTLYYITNTIILYNYNKSNIILNNNDSDNNIVIKYIKNIFGINEHNKYINKIEKIVDVDPTLSRDKINVNKNLPRELNKLEDVRYDKIYKIIEKINNILIDKYDIDYDKIVRNIINSHLNNVNITKIYNEIYDTTVLDIDVNEKKRIINIIIKTVIKEIDNLKDKVNNNNKVTTEILEKNKIIINTDTNYRRDISGLIFIILIFVISLFIIEYIITKIYYNKFLLNNIKDKTLIPLLCLFIVLFIINSTINYNTLLNKYIIQYPNNIYKQHLNDVNYKFNPIIEDEYLKYKNKNNIPKNVADGIVSIIINSLLNRNLYTKELNNIIKYPNIKQNNDEYNYNFNNMIKNNSINIFYGRGEYEENCNLVNYKKVYSLIKNTLIFSNNKLLDKLLKEIENKSFNKNKDEIINIIYYEILEKKEYSDFKVNLAQFKDKIKSIILKSLYHTVILNKNYNNKDKLDYLTLEEIDIYANSNNKTSEYDDIVNNIIKKYIELIVYNLYLLSEIKNNLTIEEILIYLNNDYTEGELPPIKFKNSIIKYINNYIKNIDNFFIELNVILTNNVVNRYNISNYIINNYNNVNKEKYIKNIIYPYNEKKKNTNSELLQNIKKINDNYYKIKRHFCNNDIEQIFTDKCQLKIVDKNNAKKDIKNLLENNINDIDNFIEIYNDNNDLIPLLKNFKENNEMIKEVSIIVKNQTENELENMIDELYNETEKYNNDNIEIYNKIIEINNKTTNKNMSLVALNNSKKTNYLLILLITSYILGIILIKYIR